MAKKTASSPSAPRRRTAAPRRRATASDPAAAQTDIAIAADPSHDDIAHAAYLRYLSRGASDGQDFDDWLGAERDLKKGSNGD